MKKAYVPTNRRRKAASSIGDVNGGDIEPNLAGRLAAGKISTGEIARLVGLSVTRVNVLRRQGKSALDIVQERRAKRTNGHTASVPAVSDPRSFSELQRARLSVDIMRKTLDVDERRGQVVARSAVETLIGHVRASFDAATREFCAMPSQLRDRCDGRPGPEIEALLDEEIRRVLARLQRANRRELERLGVGMESRA